MFNLGIDRIDIVPFPYGGASHAPPACIGVLRRRLTGSIDERETIKQLHELNDQLRRENKLLRAKISKLEARLAKYENAHSPPSLRGGSNRKKASRTGLACIYLRCLPPLNP